MGFLLLSVECEFSVLAPRAAGLELTAGELLVGFVEVAPGALGAAGDRTWAPMATESNTARDKATLDTHRLSIRLSAPHLMIRSMHYPHPGV